MIVSAVVSGIGLDRGIAAMAGLNGVDLARPVALAGAMLRTKVRAGASGRPGPRAQTGDYRRSISQTNSKIGGNVAETHVYTNAPQALRLEYGFRGVDALGRHYDQPPYPHWRPAVDGIAEFMNKEARAELARATTKFGTTRFGQRIIGGS